MDYTWHQALMIVLYKCGMLYLVHPLQSWKAILDQLTLLYFHLMDYTWHQALKIALSGCGMSYLVHPLHNWKAILAGLLLFHFHLMDHAWHQALMMVLYYCGIPYPVCALQNWKDILIVSDMSYSLDGCTLISHAPWESFAWDLTSQPPSQLASHSSSVTPRPIGNSTLLTWSCFLHGHWIKVQQFKDGHTRCICSIPPHHPATKILRSSHQTHPQIAVGCEDGCVIILAIPLDPFNWHFSEEDACAWLVPMVPPLHSPLRNCDSPLVNHDMLNG
ncbi:hypothetical protein BS47DRAFT_612983, partial [Hydnum rufescens UP504]